ncbi:MAG: hypothetical protein ABR591_00430 [Candidatus Velthaea sp.]
MLTKMLCAGVGIGTGAGPGDCGADTGVAVGTGAAVAGAPGGVAVDPGAGPAFCGLIVVEPLVPPPPHAARASEHITR